MWEELRNRRKPQSGIGEVVTINVDTHGYGDAITASWIAEGSKESARRLRLCATGERAELIRMLGQEPITPDGGCASFHTAGPEYIGSQPVGAPPVAVFRARRLGIESDPKRPSVTIPQEATDWAQLNKADVLLYPHCTEGSRTWPHDYWVQLHKRLREAGYSVRIFGMPDHKWNDCPDWQSSIPWLRNAALMKMAKLVIGNDSGPMHLAGTLNTPGLALLGRTTDAVFSLYPSVRCLSAERRQVPCAGCWGGWGYNREVCNRQCAALASISVDRVFQEAQHFLTASNVSSPIAFAVACWGDYWDKFGNSFIGSMEGMNPRPSEIVVVTDQDIACPDWIRVVRPKSDVKMWDWFNEAVEACQSEWVIVPGIDDVYFAHALADVTLEGDAIAMGLMENGRIHASPGRSHWDHHVLGSNTTDAWYPMIFRRETYLRFPWRRVINPDSHQLLEMRKARIDMRFDPRPRFEHRRHVTAHSAVESPVGREQINEMKRLLNNGIVTPGIEWPPYSPPV